MTREADTYERHAAALTGLFTGRVLDLAGDLRGRVVADVASGTGLAAREAARRGARLVVSADLLPWMTERARARAIDEALPAVKVARMDAARLGLRDAVAEVTVCQFGLMLMGEAGAAARELRRVTRPGGAVVAAVWSTPDRAPAFSVFFEAAGAATGRPDLAAEHAIFRLGGDGALASLLSAAGLAVVEEVRVEMLDARPSLDAYWRGMASVAGFKVGDGDAARVSTADRLDADTQARIRADVVERTRPFLRPDGSVAFPMEAILVRAAAPRERTTASGERGVM
jgi:SAM-dependent methyltransferase